MPPRRARVAPTLESRLKQGLDYVANLRSDAVPNMERVDDLTDALCEADPDLLGSADILGGVVAAHAWAARAVAADMLSVPGIVMLETTMLSLGSLLKGRQGDPAGDRLARALLRADTLAVYSRLLAQTLAPTRAAAARRSRMPLNQIKATQIMRVIVHMNAVAECVDESPDAGLKQELISALAHTQLLEHAAQALLHAAQATPAAPGIAAVASSAQEANEDWALVCKAANVLCNLLANLVGELSIVSLCPRPRERDILCDATRTPDQLRLLEQLRPLLAGPCLQLVAAWAGLCAAMTVRQQADGGGAVQQGVAHARSHQGYGLPAELMRPLQPLRQAEAQKSSSHLAICVMVQVRHARWGILAGGKRCKE